MKHVVSQYVEYSELEVVELLVGLSLLQHIHEDVGVTKWGTEELFCAS